MEKIKIKKGDLVRCKKTINNLFGKELFSINKSYKIVNIIKGNDYLYHLKGNLNVLNVSIKHKDFVNVFDTNKLMRKEKLNKISEISEQ